MQTDSPAPTEAIARLEAWCAQHEGSRPKPTITELEAILNAPGPQQVSIAPNGEITTAAFTADLRTLLAELAEARKAVEPFAQTFDSWLITRDNVPASETIADFRRASEFIRRVEGK